MKQTGIPRILIAAPCSGSGKTTMVCALLRVLQRRKILVEAFKNGPDYIDPMFHTRVLHTPSHNLDLFLLGRGHTGEEHVKYLLASHVEQADIAVLEGAMGYYDGIGTTSEASAYDLARVTQTPVILVVNGKGAALSLGAQIRGMASFYTPSYIAGFIVNHVSAMVYAYFKESWEQAAGIPALGYMPDMGACRFSSRHLGLVIAAEIDDWQEKIDALADTAEQTLDISGILTIARQAPPFAYEMPSLTTMASVRIAVARDEAFCFYYDDSLHVLELLGAQLVFFSPLHDTSLPSCDGIYIGGGYPELYASIWSQNQAMKQQLFHAIQRGCPCIAECGGFMYLLESFQDENTAYAGVGCIAGTSHMTKRLQRFGYITLTAQEDTMVCRAGETIQAHEFHYSDSTNNGTAFLASKAQGKRTWPCIHSQDRLLAGYPHFHFLGNLAWAKRFIAQCDAYRKEQHHEN